MGMTAPLPLLRKRAVATMADMVMDDMKGMKGMKSGAETKQQVVGGRETRGDISGLADEQSGFNLKSAPVTRIDRGRVKVRVRTDQVVLCRAAAWRAGKQ